MVTVGDNVQFDVFLDMKTSIREEAAIVIGTVYAVNYKHKVFHVVYYAGNTEQRISFNFCDIGEKVQVV